MVEPVLVITGPTASGKTALAVALARRLGGEVVSADSRQVYRWMDIGTAKPTAEERQGVPHHGFDLVSPAERYSAGRFARDARRWISDIRRRGRLPIVAGGSGFYLRALTEPLFDEPEFAQIERAALRVELENRDVEELRRWVRALEPQSRALDPERRGGGGRQRLLRSIEVAVLTGRPLGWWQRNAPAREPAVPACQVILEVPRPELHRRIDRRVTAMIEKGWVEEVRSLADRGFAEGAPGVTATGYENILMHVRSRMTLAEAVERTCRATRNYARRQLTWLRHQVPGEVLRLASAAPLDVQVEGVLRHWKECRT